MLLLKQDDNPFSHAKSFHKADAGTVICSGVSIGENTVIGAGSVVIKDIPPDSVAVGNPCRVVRAIDDRGRKYYYKDKAITAEDLEKERKRR